MTLPQLIKSAMRHFGYDIVRYSDRVKKPLDVSHIEVLEDPAFQASVNEVQRLTVLDTDRLANLWQLCRLSNPSGSLIEIGSYKGGSALHLSNAAPTRTIFVCDTFEGFGDLPLDPSLDRVFKQRQFDDTSFDRVIAQWTGKGRDVRWVRGYFPESASSVKIGNQISFAHIDLDLYRSTADTLDYLQSRFIDRSIIVFDDYLRRADGVMKAVNEFAATNRDWTAFPIFPGQGLMIHRSWFD
jgi:Macrocin-O-methyltransferase (TylF)